MAVKSMPPIMPALNPNASVFVPAGRPVVEDKPVPVFVAPMVEDFSPEWWHLVQTDASFRERWLSMISFSSAEEKEVFGKDLDELADLDQFLDYQEELVDLEEEEILALEMGRFGEFWDFDAEKDCYFDEGLDLSNVNNCKDVKTPKHQQAPWSKNFKYQNKPLPHKIGNYPKKWNTYRIHQPRFDM